MRNKLAFKLLSYSVHDSVTGCRLWTQGLEKDGYGILTHEGKQYRAHRLAFEVFKGPVPEHLLVLHRCNTRACINTEHLYLGTALDNSKDVKEAGRGVYFKGRFNYNTKLTAEQVLEIRERLKIKDSLAKIAGSFGVGVTTIRAIKIGRTWKELQ